MSERSELQFALKNPAPVYVSPQNPEAAANPPYHNLMNRTCPPPVQPRNCEL